MRKVLWYLSFGVALAVGCVEPRSDPGDGAGLPVPDPPPKDGAPQSVEAGPAPDAAVPADTAVTPDRPPAPPPPDAPPAPPPDAPLPPDAAPKPDAPPPPDAPASPCPGGPPPPGYDLRCGCTSMGKILCSGACSVDDKSCVPSGEYFVFTNQFLGEGKVLDTYGGDGPNNAFMNMPGFSGSKWTITPTGDGFYRLTNMFLLEGRPLEATTDGNKLFMGVAGGGAAQAWKITGTGTGYFRIRNRALGDGRSLDTRNDAMNDPFLGPTGDFSGEYWKITRE